MWGKRIDNGEWVIGAGTRVVNADLTPLRNNGEAIKEPLRIFIDNTADINNIKSYEVDSTCENASDIWGVLAKRVECSDLLTGDVVRRTFSDGSHKDYIAANISVLQEVGVGFDGAELLTRSIPIQAGHRGDVSYLGISEQDRSNFINRDPTLADDGSTFEHIGHIADNPELLNGSLND